LSRKLPQRIPTASAICTIGYPQRPTFYIAALKPAFFTRFCGHSVSDLWDLAVLKDQFSCLVMRARSPIFSSIRPTTKPGKILWQQWANARALLLSIVANVTTVVRASAVGDVVLMNH